MSMCNNVINIFSVTTKPAEVRKILKCSGCQGHIPITAEQALDCCMFLWTFQFTVVPFVVADVFSVLIISITISSNLIGQ